jgi:flagellar basal-body rod protein FlgF
MSVAGKDPGDRMENTLYIALSRQMTVRRQLETVANNLANANTAGYKAERLMFVEYLSKSDDGKSEMHFVQDLASARNHNPGKYEETGNALDLAIEGPGFFAVEAPDGEERYTRDGQFRMDQDGKLITKDGFPVLGEGDDPIVMQANDTNISILADGTITAGDQQRGKLKIVEFENPYRMKKAEGNLYKTNEEPADAEKSSVIQGLIEGSNVQPILEITEMMRAMRSFQSAGKFIESEHERQRRAIDRLTRETS